MSKRKPNRVPGAMRSPMPRNGGNDLWIPDDLEWDEANPPTIYPCSQATVHHPGDANRPPCDHSDEEQATALDSELQVKLINESHAWMHNRMHWNGVPVNMPFLGIPVDLVDLLVYNQVMKEVLIELSGMNEFEVEEKFREAKLELLTSNRIKHEDHVRRQRMAEQLGIAQRPSLLGPDGRPLQ